MTALPMNLQEMGDLRPENIEYIFLHTEGSPGGAHGTAASINRYHQRELGWLAIGYHLVVLADGDVQAGRPLTKMGAGVEGINARSLHVVCTGNGDLAPLTPAQEEAAVAELARLARRFRVPAQKILGHREVNALVGAGKAPKRTTKSCPGRLVSMERIRGLVAAELARTPAFVRQQLA